MLKNLLLSLSIYRLKAKMQMLQTQIKKMESINYLTLQKRIDIAQMKKMLSNLHEQEAELHQYWLTLGF